MPRAASCDFARLPLVTLWPGQIGGWRAPASRSIRTACNSLCHTRAHGSGIGPGPRDIGPSIASPSRAAASVRTLRPRTRRRSDILRRPEAFPHPATRLAEVSARPRRSRRHPRSPRGSWLRAPRMSRNPNPATLRPARRDPTAASTRFRAAREQQRRPTVRCLVAGESSHASGWT